MPQRLRGRRLWLHEQARVRGAGIISTGELVRVGVDPVGFMDSHDRSLLNVNGTLKFRSWFSLGRGCRVDVGEGAVCSFGWGYANALCRFVIMRSLWVGDNCTIAWGCEFLDDSFHRLEYDGKEEKGTGIEIGNHVWIGCGATILAGARIPDDCVIAARSVVTRPFEERGLLIGGNPARVLRRGVNWSGR